MAAEYCAAAAQNGRSPFRRDLATQTSIADGQKVFARLPSSSFVLFSSTTVFMRVTHVRQCRYTHNAVLLGWSLLSQHNNCGQRSLPDFMLDFWRSSSSWEYHIFSQRSNLLIEEPLALQPSPLVAHSPDVCVYVVVKSQTNASLPHSHQWGSALTERNSQNLVH